MPHGKAAPIGMAKIERRALENLRKLLEEISDTHTKLFGKYIIKQGRVSKASEAYHLPLLKLKAILLADDGKTNREIAREIQMSEHTIGKWRNEFIYILSRDDLPFDRIKGYFRYNNLPVENVILAYKQNGNIAWWGDASYANLH